MSPRSRSIADSRPYGGFSSGSPCGSASLLVAASPVDETTVPAAFDASDAASAPTFSPGPEMYRTPVSALADTNGRSENSLLGGGINPSTGIAVNDGT